MGAPNPEKHKARNVDREIGDVVYMAAIAPKKDMLQIIDNKLKEKWWEDTP